MGRLIWLVAISIAAFTVWYQWKDDTLLPDARRWMTTTAQATAGESDAFTYLLGIDAPADSDPRQFGRARLLRALSRVQDSADATEPSERLVLPAGEKFCRIATDSCLSSLLNNVHGLRATVAEHEVVLTRFRRFLDFEEFDSSVPAHVEKIVPPLRYLSTGNKLAQFKAIALAVDGNLKLATEEIDGVIAGLRRHLAYADALMQKVLIGSLLADNLDLAAGLYSRGLIQELENVADLTPPEIDLTRAIRREFAERVFGRGGLREVDDAQTGSANQFVFKRNRSINELFLELRQLTLRAALPASIVDDAFAAHKKMRERAPLYDISNPVGSLVVNTVAGIEPIVFRLRDLDCKLKLVRIRMQAPAASAAELLTVLPDDVDLSNPYEPNEMVAVDKNRGTLCFNGVTPDYKATRCIVL